MALGYVVADQRQLDKRLYEVVTGGNVGCLLPGALMRYPDGVLEMRYRIAGETLEQRLARPFDGTETCELLESISNALDALVAGQMPLMNLRFAADEVVMDAAGTGCRFVFLPMTGLTPNLDAVRVFFEQVAASVKPSDDIAQNAMSSFAAFFKKSGPFDILGFSRHLKQVSASAMLMDAGTTVLDDGDGDDHGTTVLDSGDDHGTTVLDDGEDLDVAAPGPVLGTVVLSDLEDEPIAATEPAPAPAPEPQPTPAPAPAPEPQPAPEPEPKPEPEPEPEPASEDEDDLADAPIAQSRPDRTGVLNPIDFKVAEGYESLFSQDTVERHGSHASDTKAPAHAAHAPKPEPAPEPKPEPAPAPAPEPKPASAPAPAPEPKPEPTPASAAPERHLRFYLTRIATGERFEVRGRRFVVGKSKHSSFMVKGSTTVSRSHAIFVTDGATCTIEDDNSRNGTFVNNERIDPGFPVALVDGDTVRMSDENFAFEVQPA